MNDKFNLDTMFAAIQGSFDKSDKQSVDYSNILKFEIGKTQLYEIAKQNYGVGIAEHIRILRIEKAKQLLENNRLPLAEIASQCGYKDYNYFITVFKRVVGISPKKYQSIFV